nr:MAG TPA: hypothetical protein [Caudoviricetes sp.]
MNCSPIRTIKECSKYSAFRHLGMFQLCAK